MQTLPGMKENTIKIDPDGISLKGDGIVVTPDTIKVNPESTSLEGHGIVITLNTIKMNPESTHFRRRWYRGYC
jgi:hypothetical protein